MNAIYKMTSELTNGEIKDILAVFNQTFGSEYGTEYFNWKYKENIYGDSLHAIVYNGDIPVSSRSFWRNDIDGIPSYQPVDTSVLPSHQKKGIFKKTALACLDLLQGSYIYNYPNDNSRTGYLKIGWKIKQKYKISFNFSPFVIKHYIKKDIINDEYVKWRFVRNPLKEYFVYKCKNEWYLLSERQPDFYAILGRISSPLNLKEKKPLLLFTYDDENCLFKLPHKRVCFLENIRYTKIPHSIPAYRFDML